MSGEPAGEDSVDKLIGLMKISDKKAMRTRDGQGEFNGSTFTRLLTLGLVDRNLRFTDLGYHVRDRLYPPKEESRG